MESFINKHLADYAAATGKTTVTTSGGAPLSLSEGIAGAVNQVRNAGKSGKTVYFIGNGGSASIASHMSVDFWKSSGIKGLAFTDPSLLTCISNDCGYAQVFSKPLDMFMSDGDLLIAISSSGRSENIINGVKTARSKGAAVITMSGFSPDNPLAAMGDINFHVPYAHYGIVEVTHALICHAILDTLTGVPHG